MWFHVAATVGILGIASALPPQRRATTYALKERHEVPSSWRNLGPASKRDTVNLKIGLVQQSPGLIEQHLLEVSDPTHERYGQHLSQEDVANIVAPAEESMSLVESWLREHGITEYVKNEGNSMIHCAVSISTVESLLDTSYSMFENEEGTRINRAPEWSLPEYLHEYIDIIQPTTSFFHPKKHAVMDEDIPLQPADCEPSTDGTTPDKTSQTASEMANNASSTVDVSKVCQVITVTSICIRTLYGTLDYVPQAPDKQFVATTNYLNETVIRDDVSRYMKSFRSVTSNVGDNVTLVQIANGDLSQQYTPEKILRHKNAEANTDVDNLWSVAYPIPLTAYHIGGSPPFIPDRITVNNTNEPYLEWLDYMLALENVPSVITTSYGDHEQTVPESYARRVCSGMAQLSARGVTLIFSSGDDGVGKNGSCISNDGTNAQRFLPVFPASCPWVTSVGATAGFGPEVVASPSAPGGRVIVSGGGFSRYFDQPDYQKATVQNYLASLNGLHNGSFNPSGRGYPDVAAHGARAAGYWNSRLVQFSGSSVGAPTFAGVVALVNDALLAAGKPVLGFLNPWLYSVGYQGLTDIISGSSAGCNTSGFPAQEGWDAVTGWGTPNFPKLMQLALDSSFDASDALPKDGGGQ